ncbi:MAG: ABC transporter permease [Alphaproteobacteria bacterium]|nr:ABC transporter permease [Alphaproteobacteria bacterium]
MKILKALVYKEFLQIIRDPSSILIAFILPFILITIFATAINLDNNAIETGLVIDGDRSQVNDIVSAFEGSRFLTVTRYNSRKEAQEALIRGDIRAMVVLPINFAKAFVGEQAATIQVLADASDPNVALFTAAYVQGIVATAQKILLETNGSNLHSGIQIEAVSWYNPELKSRYFILPNSIAIIMTLIGMLLTALVIAREWERGTMESLLTTKASKLQIITAKYISYYCLAMLSAIFCTFLSVIVFDVPFRGSLVVYFVTSSLFLFVSIGMGCMISTLTRNQFLASVAAAMFGFLPAVILSGGLFEISSMPRIIQIATNIIPATHFVPIIKNLFMAGNIWPIIFGESLNLLIFGLIMFGLLYRVTKERLE